MAGNEDLAGNRGPEPLEALRITCTSSDCGQGLHCFRATRKMKKLNEKGKCRSCGDNLVDWQRVFRRDLRDVNYTFRALKQEMIRHHFWHAEIDERALTRAYESGKAALGEAATKRIRSSVGPAEPFRDGMQTPYLGNVLYYAQHATACCCRTCIEYWHGIPKGRELSNDEISYLSDLVKLYLEERLTDLK